MTLTHYKRTRWMAQLATAALMLSGLQAALGQTGGGGGGIHSSNPDDWRPANILGVIHNPSGFSGIVAVSAHRGVYNTTGCPENSSCSVLAAEDYPVESLEIDGKADSQGVVWASHDLTVGRMTNIFFDPQTGTGSNPVIGQMRTRDLVRLDLVATAPNNNITHQDAHRYLTRYYFPTVDDLLFLHHQKETSVMLIDLKTLADTSAVANYAAGYETNYGSDVLKLSALEISDQGVTQFRRAFTRGLAWVPTLYAPMLDSIFHDNKKYYPSTQPQYVVLGVMNELAHEPGYQYIEIGNKAQNDPTWQFLQDTIRLKRGRGQFVPVPEATDFKGPGYYQSNGVCCAHLNDPALWARTSYFGNEYADTRENLQGAIDSYNFILTDEVRSAISITAREGRRNPSYYQP